MYYLAAQMSQAGAYRYDKITPKRIETVDMIDSGFTHDELSTLHHLLNKLDRHLQHMENEREDEWEYVSRYYTTEPSKKYW